MLIDPQEDLKAVIAASLIDSPQEIKTESSITENEDKNKKQERRKGMIGSIFQVNLCEIKLEEAAILHYTFSKFFDLSSRRDRCGCKPTKEDVKCCFMSKFD